MQAAAAERSACRQGRAVFIIAGKTKPAPQAQACRAGHGKQLAYSSTVILVMTGIFTGLFQVSGP